MNAVNINPVSVAVDAGNWQFYKTNTILNSDSPFKALNHQIIIVGYSSNYWIAKNSWGLYWGMSGYIQIDLTANTCGICMNGIYPQRN